MPDHPPVDNDEDDDLDPSTLCPIENGKNGNHHNQQNGVYHEQQNQNSSPSSLPLKTENLFDSIDLILIEKFWNEQRKQFIKQIFPDFFIPTLVKFDIFSDYDQIDYSIIRASRDLDNCSDRLSGYEELNEWIFDKLLFKIRCNSRVLSIIIEALRFDDWYISLADEWQTQLKRKSEQVNNQKSPESIDNKNKVKNLLINFPEPISYKIDRKTEQRKIESHLKEMFENGMFIFEIRMNE